MSEELVVYGRRAVLEALRSEQPVERLFLDRELPDAVFRRIYAEARRRGVVVQGVPRSKLTGLAGEHHQGVVALCAAIAYADLEDMIQRADAAHEALCVMMLDGVQDPHNIGSLIRSCEVAGAHGMILPVRRGGSVTPAVVRVAAGAAMHLPIARVSNLGNTAISLQRRGLAVAVADPSAETLIYDADLRQPLVLVVGGEGRGTSERMRKLADLAVRIPQRGRVESLNVSVAGAVLLFEVIRQRLLDQARP